MLKLEGASEVSRKCLALNLKAIDQTLSSAAFGIVQGYHSASSLCLQ